ncbi:MAG: HEAT repeat domain-containing protein [Planctomycetota bacterium]
MRATCRLQPLALGLVLVTLPAGLGGCASSKKLADGGPVDGLVYGVLGFDRDPRYYFEKLRDSHDPESEDFAYRLTSDTYLVDKSVDAAGRLGGVDYSRLEGQAQAAVLLSNVVLEDPAALARTQAASSLTQMGLKLPRYPRPPGQRDRIERGDNLLAALRELDAMHAGAGGPLRDAAYGPRRLFLVNAIGDMNIVDLEIARDAVRPFTTRGYLIDTTEPALRTATDTALVKRMGDLIRLSLQAALDAPYDHVRREALIGLKLLGDRRSEDAVLTRLPLEPDWQVRSEAIEYLGKMASEKGVEALLPILEDGDPTLRHKARQALVRIAGRDLGRERSAWTSWAEARYPELAQRLAERRAARERAKAGPSAAPDTPDPTEPTGPAPADDLPSADDVLPSADDVLPPADDVLPPGP